MIHRVYLAWSRDLYSVSTAYKSLVNYQFKSYSLSDSSTDVNDVECHELE